MKNQIKDQNVEAIRLLVRAREDFQSQRIRMDNRIGLKANGESQNVDMRMIKAEDYDIFKELAEGSKDREKYVEKMLKKMLKRFPIYNEYLANIKGVGTISAAHIIASINIHEATTVSKIWQYAGMNPGEVPGKIRIQTENPDTYESKKGKIIKRGKDHVIIQTNELIRGDKMKSPFLCPFNKDIKKALLGVMADVFIKTQNEYAINHYYPEKQRLENSSQMTKEVVAGGKIKEVMWKDAKKNHIHFAAKRKMIKMFLLDLYVAWRGIEGLSVREPYNEEYLGHYSSRKKA